MPILTDQKERIMMNETIPTGQKRRGIFAVVLLPLAICAIITVVFQLFADCRLIRIEDAYTWRILSGAYGTPDWRVLEMNPLLSQLLALLFNVLPAVPWYGLTLLVTLCCSCAALMGLAARKRGGLLPALFVIAPICALLNYSMISTTVAALASAAGFLMMLESFRAQSKRTGKLVASLLLYLLGAALNITYAAIVTGCLFLCALPNSAHDGRIKSLAKGVPLAAVLLAALFGYQSLMFSSAELSAYRSNYTRYDRLQHSTLPAEVDRLLNIYGTADFGTDGEGSGHDGHDHEEETETSESEEGTDLAATASDEERSGIFYEAGFTLNDAQLFFTRIGADPELIAPERLEALEGIASYVDTDMDHLFSSLVETLGKPQFLMLIALFVFIALAVLLTSRRRGLTALLAALLAFGAHVFLIMCNYDAFAYIAPFYLASIAAMLYSLDGEHVMGFSRHLVRSQNARAVIGVVVCMVIFVGCAGLVFYSVTHPTNGDNNVLEDDTVAISTAVAQSASSDSPMLFIGDNPADRYKYKVLEATPEQGSCATLLAGGYDLYSPRYAAMLEEFDTDNPLRDSVTRDDIAYINMGFVQNKLDRIRQAYGGEYFVTEPLFDNSKILSFKQLTEEEFNTYIETQEQAAQEEFEARLAAGDLEALATQALSEADAIAEETDELYHALEALQESGTEEEIAQAQAAFEASEAEYNEAFFKYIEYYNQWMEEQQLEAETE